MDPYAPPGETAAQVHLEALTTLATEQGFPFWTAEGMILHGWALAAEGQGEQGIAQMRQGLDASRALGVEMGRPSHLALLAEAYGNVGQADEGLTILEEAFAAVANTAERSYEAELYRLQGELTVQATLQRATGPVASSRPNVQWAQAPAQTRLVSRVLSPEGVEWFQQALAIARQQQAKALELRAALSLARLWQQQGKRTAARELLAPVYGWFTEGFDTVDLQEAQALLAELS